MGQRPNHGLSIDRINNNGNYEPSNCRWASMAIQSANKRNNIHVVIDGVHLCLRQACKQLGKNYSTVHGRVHVLGWTPYKALGLAHH
jgi:hypothetical protein